MAYIKTVWVNGTSPAISDTNLNKIEQGIFDSFRQDGTTEMSAQLVTVAGSATTPAIAPTGDSNNGIYFPTSDQMAYTASGVQRLLLDINSIKNFSETTGIGLVNVGIATQRTTNDSQLYISYRTTPDAWVIGATYSTTGAYKPIVFATSDSERMRITAAGNVGIGTTSPSTLLTVAGNITTTTDSYGVGPSGTNNNFNIFSTGAAGAIYLFSGGTNVTAQGGGGTARMTILAGGNVGIGSTNPSAKLELSDGTITGQLDLVASGFYVGSKSAHPTVFFTNNTEKMRLTAGGNLGIGTTSPSVVLHAKTAGEILRLETTTARGSGNALLQFNDPTGQKAYFGYASSSSDNFYLVNSLNTPMLIGNNGVENMRITAAGKVGIGTSSPNSSALLDVLGNIYTGTGTTSTNFVINNSGSSTADGLFVIIGGGVGNPSWDFGTKGAADTFVIGYTASAARSERMRVTAAGYLLIGYTASNGAYPLQVNGQIFATSSTIATSDQKYKKNIVQLTDALSIVSALNPVQFDWKEHPVHKFNTDVPTVGFIAQEVAEALKDQPYLDSIVKKSECSWEEETGDFAEETTEVDGVIETIQKPVTITKTEEFLGIAESNMIAILTKAVQELKAEIDALKAQIAGK